MTGTDADAARQLQQLEAELHAAVTDLERVLADPASGHHCVRHWSTRA